jgi:hypothetical protein
VRAKGITVQLYFSSMSGQYGWVFWLLIVLGTFLCEGNNSVQTWFLGYWASQYETHPSDEVSVAL